MGFKKSSFRGILIATILGSGLAFIDSSIVNVILPRIQAEFEKNLSSAQWVIQAYGLFLSTFLLLGGALGDHYGRKRIFQTGLLIFIFGSGACALSQSFLILLVARSLQGLGAALMTPQSLAIINATFPKEARSRAIGLWSAFSAISGAVGPPLGGWLSDIFGWRAAFVISLPLGFIAFMVAHHSIPKDCGEARSANLDLRGTLISTLGIGALILALTEKNAVFGIIGFVLLGVFIWIERSSPHPLLPLSVFKSRTFSLTNIFTVVLYAGLGGAFFYLPLHLISIERYTSAQAGIALLPLVMLLFTLSPIIGSLLPRTGARLMLTLGPVISACGFFLISFLAHPASSYWNSYFPGLCLIGLGMALTVAPLTTTVLGALDDSYSGLASGLNNAAARIAGLLGVAFTAMLGSLIFEGTLAKFHFEKQIIDDAINLGPFGSHLLSVGHSNINSTVLTAATEAAFSTLHFIMIGVSALFIIAALFGSFLKKRAVT